MARYIHCPDCKILFEASAKKYNELYEAIEGVAIKEMLCDGCSPAKEIKIGDRCFAAVLLPNKNHFNYQSHTPKNWASEYIKETT